MVRGSARTDTCRVHSRKKMTADDHHPSATADTERIYRDRFSLRFANPRLEAAFKHDYFHQSLRQIRVSLLGGGLLYAAFGLLDTSIVPASTAITWIIRYAIVCPVIATVFVLSFTRYFERRMEMAMIIAGAVASFGIVAMISVAVPPGNYLYYAGLLLAATYIYTVMRLAFVPASLVNWSTVALYEAVALSTGTTPPGDPAEQLFLPRVDQYRRDVRVLLHGTLRPRGLSEAETNSLPDRTPSGGVGERGESTL